MADLLIKHLKEKGEEHSALSLLVSQWGFDERLIPKALQGVSSLFPHYSRHDESHSRQILVNIERLLGVEGIALLSATDTWLILEAAYWHDIGMVVSRRDIAETIASADFSEYLASICDDKNHYLRTFALAFRSEEAGGWLKSEESPVRAMEKFRELLSEWFRRKHPERARLIVDSPFESIGLTSPRTELIPARLFKLLGSICHMHGGSFEDVLATLPYKQTGVGQDDCHPRFVACLLRLGDLLDLDDNRFCPVMQKISGDERPALSKAHEEKHSAIRHLRIDRDRIEIKAECASVEGYIESCKWFDWLRMEMHCQMAHWQDIVPSRELGLLPTLGELEVILVGDYRVLKSGQTPQFNIDPQKAFSLLQGANIYESRFAYVQEILQNAVDATLIRLWVTHPKASVHILGNPRSAQSLLQQYKVYVELIEGEASEHDGSVWTLKVSDQGTGIGISDLAYMLRVGASQENRKRQRIVNQMPEWLKPSGAFGIGLQSIFMVCDSVMIRTKDIFSNEALELVMHSPTSSKEGMVFIKKIVTDVSEPCGSTIEFEFSLPESEGSPLAIRNGSISSSVALGYDPIYGDSYSYEAAKIADKISDFADGSLVGIEGVVRTRRYGSFQIEKSKRSSKAPDFDYVDISCGEQQELIGVYYRFVDEDRNGPAVRVYYRGQPFKFEMASFPLLDVRINLMSGHAGDWLAASRSEVAAAAKQKLVMTIVTALYEKFKKDLKRSEGWEDEYEKKVSLFLAVMASKFNGVWSDLSDEIGDKWLDAEQGHGSLRHLFSSTDSWTVGVGSHQNMLKDVPGHLQIGRKYEYLLPVILAKWQEKNRHSVTAITYAELVESGSETIVKYLNELGAGSKSFFSGFIKEDLEKSIFYRMNRQKKDFCTEGALLARLHELASGGVCNQRYYTFLDANLKKYRDLSIKENSDLKGIEPIFAGIVSTSNKIVLPFLFRKGFAGGGRLVDATGLNDFCLFVQSRLKRELPVSRIKDLYEDLIAFIDTLMDHSSYGNEWLGKRKDFY
ncbi:hypothetical protein [Pseudomonas sp. NPDC008258]|uniref:HD domain-containing protein n=1 Tax=Pseudomonas sp. NPDC008258 TaxID=3364418 RepID=UPI0036E93B6E